MGKKQQFQTSNTSKMDQVKATKMDQVKDKEIHYDSLWDEYQIKYQYSPKKALHFWNFIKEEKFLSIKFKDARFAFNRISRERAVSDIEGCVASNNSTDFILKTENNPNNDIVLILKVTKYTSSKDLAEIKIKFLELLQTFRSTILDDPASALQLFNFINERTKFKVKHGDVVSCYDYAVKHEWFEPMKRMYKKTKSENNESEEGSDYHDSNEGEKEPEFELVVDHEKREKNKKKKRKNKTKKVKVCLDVMSDEQFDELLVEYNVLYENPPRNASQIMVFGKQIGRNYKYKACRNAFARWVDLRKSIMPKNKK